MERSIFFMAEHLNIPNLIKCVIGFNTRDLAGAEATTRAEGIVNCNLTDVGGQWHVDFGDVSAADGAAKLAQPVDLGIAGSAPRQKTAGDGRRSRRDSELSLRTQAADLLNEFYRPCRAASGLEGDVGRRDDVSETR